MYPWLEALLVASIAIILFYVFSPKPHKTGLISRKTKNWTEGIRQKYGIQGIYIGVVASGQHGDTWRQEIHGFVHMDEHGTPVDGEVSLHSAITGGDES
jgi:hypothetical protein